MMVKVTGGILYVVGGIGVLLIDVAATLWLASTHGIGWAILAWATLLPLLIIPFLAGFGVIYVVALSVMVAGSAIAGTE